MKSIERGLKIGLPLAALILGVAVVAPAQVGRWVSSATGVSTGGTMSVTGASTLTGTVTTGAGVTAAGVVQASALTTQSTVPSILLDDSDGGLNQRRWLLFANGGTFSFATQSDDGLSSDSILSVTRSGTTVTAITPAARINSGAEQPGFLAYNSANDSAGSGATIDFDTEVYDTTNNFAADTFTAPVTGIYMLCTQVVTVSGSLITAQITTSNRTYDIQAADVASAQTTSGCVFADMDAADTAKVVANTVSATIFGTTNPYTYFTGRLMP